MCVTTTWCVTLHERSPRFQRKVYDSIKQAKLVWNQRNPNVKGAIDSEKTTLFYTSEITANCDKFDFREKQIPTLCDSFFVDTQL